MQREAIIIVAIVAVAVVVVCLIGAVVVLQLASQPRVEPALAPSPTQDPTFTPTSGVPLTLTVGTSPDYPPFEFMVDGQVDGFDIALMGKIGEKLNRRIDWRKKGFDGLAGALNSGDIDAAIAGISVTDERAAQVLFSNTYYTGEDRFLASADSPIWEIAEIEDLSTYRVGAQRGTVYADYLQSEFVDKRGVPQDQLALYADASDAVEALQQDLVDLVMLDQLPAQHFAEDGTVKIVGGGLHQQNFAIALPKDDTDLRDQINSAIADLFNEGVVDELSAHYLDLGPEHILPTSAPTTPPEEAPTTAPTPLCRDNLKFQEHLNLDDWTGSDPPIKTADQTFNWGWSVQNNGTCDWDSSYTLVPAAGDEMGGTPRALQGTIKSGDTYEIYVDNLVAPAEGGTYQDSWVMQNGNGGQIGDWLDVVIQVPYPTGTSEPTHTPEPTQTPTATPTASIQFWIEPDDDHIEPNDCVTFKWRTENVKGVYFSHDGQNWQEHGVNGNSQSQECPQSTLTYYLHVVKNDDQVEKRERTIWVEDTPDPPRIVNFGVDPDDHIRDDGTVTLHWEVQGDIDAITIYQDNQPLFEPPRLAGSKDITPPVFPGHCEWTYMIVATGPDGPDATRQAGLTDSGCLPPVDPPVIDNFDVQPNPSNPACVIISWATSGGTVKVNIWSEEKSVLTGADPIGSNQPHCPEKPEGTVHYTLVAINSEGDTKQKKTEVQFP